MKTVITIFGITGELAARKLLPAILNLKEPVQVVGFSRRDLSKEAFQKEIRENYFKYNPKSKKAEKFLASIPYFSGSYDNLYGYLKNYKSKLFYLSLPPSVYEQTLQNVRDEKGTKILIEKPFGTSLENAKKLESLIKKRFKKAEVLKVDHYLGKNGLEKLKFKKKIKRIEIDLLEREEVGEREEFYDAVGALRDVGQNHLLALLHKVLGKIPTKFTKIERGQYVGYKKDSETETFFRIIGKNFILTAGKALRENKTEVRVFLEGEKKPKIIKLSGSGYDQVFKAALSGNKSLFPDTKQILAQWKFTESVLREMKKVPLIYYKKLSSTNFLTTEPSA